MSCHKRTMIPASESEFETWITGVCLSAISMMFVKIVLSVCMLVGMVHSVNCVQSGFL